MKTRTDIEQQIIEKAVEDKTFLKQLKQDPKKVISEFLPDDIEIPEGVSIKVMQETPNELVLRLPFTISDEELSADELDTVSAGGYGEVIDNTVHSLGGQVLQLAYLGLACSEPFQVETRGPRSS